MNAVLACLAATAVLLYAFLSAASPVSLRVRPQIGFAPLTVRADVSIPRDPSNREACVQLDGTMFSESCWPLDGEKSPTVFTRFWVDLPAGEYQTRAGLRRTRDVQFTPPVSVTVIGDE